MLKPGKTVFLDGVSSDILVLLIREKDSKCHSHNFPGGSTLSKPKKILQNLEMPGWRFL